MPNFMDFGFDHTCLNKAGIIDKLETLYIAHDPGSTVAELLPKLEKYCADVRELERSNPKDYLKASFDPKSWTVPKLRQVMSQYDIAYNYNHTKDELVEDFLDVLPIIKARNGLANPDDGGLAEGLDQMDLEPSSYGSHELHPLPRPARRSMFPSTKNNLKPNIVTAAVQRFSSLNPFRTTLAGHGRRPERSGGPVSRYRSPEVEDEPFPSTSPYTAQSTGNGRRQTRVDHLASRYKVPQFRGEHLFPTRSAIERVLQRSRRDSCQPSVEPSTKSVYSKFSGADVRRSPDVDRYADSHARRVGRATRSAERTKVPQNDYAKRSLYRTVEGQTELALECLRDEDVEGARAMLCVALEALDFQAERLSRSV